MSLLMYLDNVVLKSFTDCGYKLSKDRVVNLSDRPDLSQFQCNEALRIAKEIKKNPKEIATRIAEELEKNAIFDNVSIAGPGFINMVISDVFLANYIQEMSIDSKMGIRFDNPKKIIIDFGGANVAKPLHVGHLRSAIIGEGLKRLARELGHEVIGDVHLGDWGRQMGILISEIKRRKPDLVYFDKTYNKEYPKESPVTLRELGEIYPTASVDCKENEERMQEAREATAILQNEDMEGHKGYHALWKHMVNESIKDLKKNYDKLGVSFELWRGESDCNKSIPDMMDFLENKGLLKESDGATIMDVSELNDQSPVPPVILKTKHDSVGYQTTDLATIWERVHEFNPDEIWYVVDGRQNIHFKQIFRAAYKSGIAPENLKLRFIDFGTMNGKDGKPFKTRDGGVMKLDDLLQLVQKAAKEKFENEERGALTEEEKERISCQIADAIIKYADAQSNRSTDYIFDIDKFTAMQGKTGPYILYSAVRINSLLKKAVESGIEIDGELQSPSQQDERNLMLIVSKLPDILDTAFENKSMTDIADYLFELNSAYNNFYANNKILGEENKEKQSSWLKLSSIVERINKKLLNIMAIEEPSKM